MKDNKPHIISYNEHLGTWMGLLLLTVLTVVVSIVNADLAMLTVVTALVIATTKAILVAYYFMHLKFEHKLYKIMLLIVMGMLSTFMILTIIDYSTR